MSSPDSNNQDESPEAEAGGREGSDPIEALVTPAQLVQAMTAVADLAERLGNVERAQQAMVRVVRDALARTAGPTPTAEEVPRQVLQTERSMLWTWETTHESTSSRLPRPSIIGRALYDLQQAAAGTYEGSTPAEIYITISVHGEHHLSEVARDRVDRYQAGETRAMSGKINEHLAPRFHALSNRTDGRNYAENVGNRRSLTARGSRVFANWPHWEARDNDPTGDGPSTSSSAPPAGGTGTT